MKILYHMIFLLFLVNVHSQNVVVVDSIDKKPLSYVAVKFNDDGFYTSNLGVFDMLSISNDSLELFFMGYENKKLLKNNIRDTIFMKSKVNVLDDVIISQKTSQTKVIKPFKKASNFGSWVLMPKTEIVAIIYPNKTIRDLHLDKVTLVFEKVIERRQEKSTYKNINAVFRVNIYDIQNEMPHSLRFSSDIIEVNAFYGGEIEVDISNQMIALTDNGICLSIEMIGFYDDSNNIVPTGSFIRPALTSKTCSDYNMETYLKYVFKNNNELQSINEILEKGMPDGKQIHRNVVLGLTFSE